MATALHQDVLTSRRRVSFDTLHGFSPLYRSYVDGGEVALQFFAHDWRSAAARQRASAATLQHPRDRLQLAAVLEEQNLAWSNTGEAVRASIEALRSEQSVAVVTGQQLGLFGGPLFTLYKAVTAILLARQLAREQGRQVVPVFWVADEDHDWEEVRRTTFLARDGLHHLSLPGDGRRVPVGRRQLDSTIDGCHARYLGELPATGHTAWLAESLSTAYRAGINHRDAFATWMARIFGGTGLLFISGDDPRLKRVGAPVFEREVSSPGIAFEALTESASGLQQAGFHVQVAPSLGNLFTLDQGSRDQLDPSLDGGYALRTSGHLLSSAEAIAFTKDHPEQISPNVILRPLYEATILPTAAYVAGPGEIAYYAQMRGVYERFGVPMPCIYPRASVTIIEPRVDRALGHLGLKLEDLVDGSPERLEHWHRRLALEASATEVESGFDRARNAIDGLMSELRPTVRESDITLDRSLESTRVRMAQALDALENKVVRAEKRKAGEVRKRLKLVFDALMPDRRLQERGLGALHLLNASGPRLIEMLLEEVSLDVSQHQVLPAPV